MRCRAGLVLVFLLCGTVPAARAQSKSDAIDALWEAFMREERVVGVAVAAMKNVHVIHARGYGLASLKHGVRVTERPVFRIAHLHDAWRTAIALWVEQEGRLIADA